MKKDDKVFLKFHSWHEIGLRDLPAMIDKILASTGLEKISYIGHSQGTTIFFAMAAEMPEYANKIVSMHALAPVAFCKHMKSPLLKFMSKFSHSLTVSFLQQLTLLNFNKIIYNPNNFP